MDHAQLSPSSAHRWVPCPGSVREEAKYPSEGTSGPAAIDGTHSHTLLEHCIKNDLMDPVMDCIGMQYTDHEGTFTVDEERAQRVKMAIEYVRARKASAKTMAIRAEEKVDPGRWFGRDDMEGTADVQLIEDKLIEVIDYKDGMSPVSPVENLQLIQYGLGALFPYHEEGHNLPFDNIRLTIIQPKLAVKGMEPITSWEVSVGDLFMMCDTIKSAADLTSHPNAPLVPGEVQCKWCRAKGNCSALANKALQDAQVMFGQVDMAKQAADQEPTQLTNEKIKEILEAKPLITEFLAAVEAEAMRRFETGQRVPGLKVVRGRGSRNWALPEEEMAAKLKAMGMPKDVIFPAKLISPAQVSKVSWVKRSGDKKALSDRQIKTIEANYISKSQGKLTIALESDSRAEVTMDAASMFADVKPVETEIPEVPEKPAMPSWLA